MVGRIKNTLFVIVLVVLCSHGVVNEFGRDLGRGLISSSVIDMYPRQVFWLQIKSAIEICGMLIYQNVPLGQSPLSDSLKSHEWREAVILTLSLGELFRKIPPPSVVFFIGKLVALSVVSVFVLLLIQRRRDPVVFAWIGHVGLRGALKETWMSSIGSLAASIVLSNLIWKLWMKVHWIYRAETDYYELFNVQGVVKSQMRMIEEYPIAVGLIGPICVVLGGILLHMAILIVLINRRSLAGAHQYGFCRQCGYQRAHDKSNCCPECGLSNDQSQRQLGNFSRLKIKGLAVFIASFVMFSAPLWLGWFAPYIPEELLRFLPF